MAAMIITQQNAWNAFQISHQSPPPFPQPNAAAAAAARFQVISPPPSLPFAAIGAPNPAAPPLIRPKNDVELTRELLITILEYFSQLLPVQFPGRPLRLVVHGGACMLLHPMLYTLSSQQHQLHPTLPHRSSTRDVDYIHRSFATEMSQLGVLNAAEKLKMCIEATARHFNLGADWMNSDADIALPMATGPNGMSYDPIYYASVQPNNIELHTIFRSRNSMLALISVTPFWAVSLKLVRYTPQDAADICLLLRNGTVLSNTQWSFDTLREWLFANCWVMGYSSYDRTRLQQFNVRLQHAIKMVSEWGMSGNSTGSSPPNRASGNAPMVVYDPSTDPNNIANLMKADREAAENAKRANNTNQPQSQVQQPSQLQLPESTWASVNVNFTPHQMGRITPLAAMGGDGEVVGGEHGRGWTLGFGQMPIQPLQDSSSHPPNSQPLQDSSNRLNSTRNSPTQPIPPDPFDFSVANFPIAALTKEKKKSRRKQKHSEEDSEIDFLPMNSGRKSLTAEELELWTPASSSPLPNQQPQQQIAPQMPVPAISGNALGLDTMGSDLMRSLEGAFPVPRPDTLRSGVVSPPVPPPSTPMPQAYSYGSMYGINPSMHPAVIPVMSNLGAGSSSRGSKKDKEKEKKSKQREKEKKKKEKRKDRERRREREMVATERWMSASYGAIPGGSGGSGGAQGSSYDQEYYQRALGLESKGKRRASWGERGADVLSDSESGSEEEGGDETETETDHDTEPVGGSRQNFSSWNDYGKLPPPHSVPPPDTVLMASQPRTPPSAPSLPLGHQPETNGATGPSAMSLPVSTTQIPVPPIPPPYEGLVPIPPVSTPLPDEETERARRKRERKKEKEKKKAKEREREKEPEPFIPPSEDYQDEPHVQNQMDQRQHPVYQQPQQIMYQQSHEQLHAFQRQQNQSQYSQPIYPHQQQQQQQYHALASPQYHHLSQAQRYSFATYQQQQQQLNPRSQ